LIKGTHVLSKHIKKPSVSLFCNNDNGLEKRWYFLCFAFQTVRRWKKY